MHTGSQTCIACRAKTVLSLRGLGCSSGKSWRNLIQDAADLAEWHRVAGQIVPRRVGNRQTRAESGLFETMLL